MDDSNYVSGVVNILETDQVRALNLEREILNKRKTIVDKKMGVIFDNSDFNSKIIGAVRKGKLKWRRQNSRADGDGGNLFRMDSSHFVSYLPYPSMPTLGKLSAVSHHSSEDVSDVDE